VKEVYEGIIGSSIKPVNVFIYGTKQAGISVAKALKGNNEFNYRVMGFISDENHMIGKELMGVTIYAHNRESLPDARKQGCEDCHRLTPKNRRRSSIPTCWPILSITISRC